MYYKFLLTILITTILTACLNDAKAGTAYEKSFSTALLASTFIAERGDDHGDAYEDSVEAAEEADYIEQETERQKK